MHDSQMTLGGRGHVLRRYLSWAEFLQLSIATGVYELRGGAGVAAVSQWFVRSG